MASTKYASRIIGKVLKKKNVSSLREIWKLSRSLSCQISLGTGGLDSPSGLSGRM